MPAVEEKYRRLPGRRRGLGSSASLWMGSDHILLVKSAWFREEYKRFYLRDIQAVVVAPCARFYVSTPLLILALAWLLLAIGIAFWPSAAVIGWGIGGIAMLAAWLAISMAASCRCRLYTAVSKDDLPSLYRTWAARRFLRQVQPLIQQVQGPMDAGWAAAELSHAGPAAAATAPVESRPANIAHSHSLVSDLFLLSLAASAIVRLATVRSLGEVWVRVNTGLTLLPLAGAVAVLVQYARGRLARGFQRIAIASLVLTAVIFYAQTLTSMFVGAAMIAAASRSQVATPHPLVIFHQVADGLELLLSLIGAAITLRGVSGVVRGGGADAS